VSPPTDPQHRWGATNKGFIFKHTGDGVCAAFSSAKAAADAAVAAQRALELPVGGQATGEPNCAMGITSVPCSIGLRG
jgi:class 3 adenylate cyclase